MLFTTHHQFLVGQTVLGPSGNELIVNNKWCSQLRTSFQSRKLSFHHYTFYMFETT